MKIRREAAILEKSLWYTYFILSRICKLAAILNNLCDVPISPILTHIRTFEWRIYIWPWPILKVNVNAMTIFVCKYLVKGDRYNKRYTGDRYSVKHLLSSGVVSTRWPITSFWFSYYAYVIKQREVLRKSDISIKAIMYKCVVCIKYTSCECAISQVFVWLSYNDRPTSLPHYYFNFELIIYMHIFYWLVYRQPHTERYYAAATLKNICKAINWLVDKIYITGEILASA